MDRNFSSGHKENNTNNRSDASSIMGATKKEERKPVPSDDARGQYESIVLNANNFDAETRAEVLENTILKKDLNDLLVKNNHWEEEQEWQYQEDSETESGFATGVTFQELSTAGQLLTQDVLEPDLERQAVSIIQKIQGTELFSLLENSLDDASTKIVSLLNKSTPNDLEAVSSKGNNGVEGFDIGEFV